MRARPVIIVILLAIIIRYALWPSNHNYGDVDGDGVGGKKSTQVQSKAIEDLNVPPVPHGTQHILAIVNVYGGVAGGRDGERAFTSAYQVWKERGLHVVVKIPQYSGHAENIVKEYDPMEDVSLIAVVGGDGTIGQVSNGLYQRGVNKTMAIIPAGTGNGLAFGLGLTKGEWRKAALTAIDGTPTPVDAGRLDVFGVAEPRIAALDFYTGWVCDTNDVYAERLRWIGPSRYELASVLNILYPLHYYSAHMEFTLANGTVYAFEDQINLFVVGMNTPRNVVSMMMWPDNQLNDGFLRAILIRGSFNRWLQIQTLLGLKDGSHVQLDGMEYITFSRVVVTRDEARMGFDGEPRDETLHPKWTLEALPGHLTIMS